MEGLHFFYNGDTMRVGKKDTTRKKIKIQYIYNLMTIKYY
jgi:hypothetical protein